MAIAGKMRTFEEERSELNGAAAKDATKSAKERAVARAKHASAVPKPEALTVTTGDVGGFFQTLIKPHGPFNVAGAFGKTARIAPRDGTDRSRAASKLRMRIANAFCKECGVVRGCVAI